MTDVTYWDCDERAELLRHEDINEAIGAHLDDLDEIPEQLKVYGYSRMKVTPGPSWDPLDDMLDKLDEEYGGSDCDGTERTEKMMAALLVFQQVIVDEYVSWACERVTEKTIDAREWVRENRPEWCAWCGEQHAGGPENCGDG